MKRTDICGSAAHGVHEDILVCHFCEPEICNLHAHFSKVAVVAVRNIDEDVVGLEISVGDAPAVQMLDGREYLKEEELCFQFLQMPSCERVIE